MGFAQQQVAVRFGQYIVGLYPEKCGILPALFEQPFSGVFRFLGNGFYFDKTAQSVQFVEVNFDIVHEIDFPPFMHFDQDAQRPGQRIFERRAIGHGRQGDFRCPGLGLVGAPKA